MAHSTPERICPQCPVKPTFRALSGLFFLIKEVRAHRSIAQVLFTTNEGLSALQLRVTIVPQQASWPAPEYLHWQKLHAAANEARERLSKFYRQADEIDRNADISRDGKDRQRSKTAAQAIADFEASKTLARAREAVELGLAKHDIEQHVRETTRKALKEAEQGWQRAIDKIAERASLTKGPDTRVRFRGKAVIEWCC
jgi:cysteinyl-tRNA synthetase